MKTNFKRAKFGKIVSFLLAIAIVITLVPMAMLSAFAEDGEKPTGEWKDYAAESFGGGTGTKEDPYLIASEEQLAKLSVDVAGTSDATANSYFGKWFKLTSDLDLSEHRWNPIGQHRWSISLVNPDDERGDTISNYFEGNFDGNGKTIRGIYVDEQEDGFAGGLFGYVAINSSGSHNDIVICDLTIKDAKIYGNGNGLKNGYNGILAANLMGSDSKGRITVKNVRVSGIIDITDADQVKDMRGDENWGCYMAGGMASGADYVDFIDCSVDYIDLKGECANSGGFVAISGTCTFIDCSVRGTIEGQWGMGGFVGYAAAAGTYNKFTRCVANVDVTATDWNVGGFCGYSCCSAEFIDCAAFGDVESKVTSFSPRVSGFIGYIQNLNEYDNYQSMNSILTNCYFGGTIKSAHPEILPSVFASVDDELVVKNCTYNSDKNSNINLFSDVYDEIELTSYTATALSGDAFYNAVCNDLYGHHQYDGNTCKICELKMIYVNDDGYWVVDGCATDIKAVGEDGENGINGTSGVDGKNSLNGLSITATVIGSVALASNIALIAYALIKKKIFF